MMHRKVGLSSVKTYRVREASVMGRSAVAVVIACLQPSALLQLLTGEEASNVVADAGPPALPYVWSAAILLSGVMWVVSMRVKDEQDKNLFQIMAAFQVALGGAVYIASLVDTRGLVGTSFLVGMLTALVINCLGFCWFLTRQTLFARRVARNS